MSAFCRCHLDEREYYLTSEIFNSIIVSSSALLIIEVILLKLLLQLEQLLLDLVDVFFAAQYEWSLENSMLLLQRCDLTLYSSAESPHLSQLLFLLGLTLEFASFQVFD